MIRVLSVLAASAIAHVASGCSGDSTMPDGDVLETIEGVEAPPPTADTMASLRTIHADVVAIDQAYVYSRFGSFNPRWIRASSAR